MLDQSISKKCLKENPFFFFKDAIHILFIREFHKIYMAVKIDINRNRRCYCCAGMVFIVNAASNRYQIFEQLIGMNSEHATDNEID